MSLLKLSRGFITHRQVLNKCDPSLVISVRCCSDAVKKDIITSNTQNRHKDDGNDTHVNTNFTDQPVNRLDKHILVWGGKYKSVAEVPNLVRQDVIERARNKARIKINLMMVGGTFLGCILMMYLGKKAQKTGESVSKMNLDWHKRVNEEHRLSKEKE